MDYVGGHLGGAWKMEPRLLIRGTGYLILSAV
jgi:hypothetical protein